MSKYITGQEIIQKHELRDFEFYNDYVRKGLTPLNHAGQPYMPYDVMAQLFNLAGKKEELDSLEDLTHDLDWEDTGSLKANRIIPLQQNIEKLEARLAGYADIGWDEFELPQAQDEARHVLNAILTSYFDKAEVVKTVGGRGLDKVPELPEKPKKPRKLRPDQRHKLAWREVAPKIWKEHPEMTIEDMIHRDELNVLCEGKSYTNDTMRGWINDLAPDRSPGRRPKKKNQ